MGKAVYDSASASSLWWAPLVAVIGLLSWSSPVGATSPCDSETVVPDQESPLRHACEVLGCRLERMVM